MKRSPHRDMGGAIMRRHASPVIAIASSARASKRLKKCNQASFYSASKSVAREKRSSRGKSLKMRVIKRSQRNACILGICSIISILLLDSFGQIVEVEISPANPLRTFQPADFVENCPGLSDVVRYISRLRRTRCPPGQSRQNRVANAALTFPVSSG